VNLFIIVFDLGLTAFLVLNMSYIIQLKFSPYDDPVLNRLEESGLGVGAATLYLGLWTFKDDSALKSTIMGVVTWLILFMNIMWLGYAAAVYSVKVTTLLEKVGAMIKKKLSKANTDEAPRVIIADEEACVGEDPGYGTVRDSKTGMSMNSVLHERSIN